MAASLHIVAVPFVWPGHVTPMLHLCKRLAASGCTVTLIKAPDRAEDLNLVQWDQGVKILSALPLPPPRLPPAVRGSQERTSASVQGVLGYLDSFQSLGDAALEIVKGEDTPAACIISDVYVGWAADLAEQLNVPWFALWTSTVAELLIYYHMQELISKEIFPFAGSPSEEPITCIPGISKLRPTDYPTLCLLAQSAVSVLLHRCKELVVRGIPRAKVVLANTIYELEKGPIESLRNSGINVQPVGPLHVLSALKSKQDKQPTSSSEVIQWLDKKPQSSVLYVAFGTTMPAPRDQFTELAMALEECGCYFIWSIRDGSLLPEGFKEKMASTGQGMVVSFAPQLEVLNHGSVAGFFTHCGWNSVLESISIGVPMIARPISCDQALTKKLLVEDWGLALGLEGLHVSYRKEIRQAIESLMKGSTREKLRNKAVEIKELVMTAAEGTSSKNLEAAVSMLIS